MGFEELDVTVCVVIFTDGGGAVGFAESRL